jgi:hypothetical protein
MAVVNWRRGFMAGVFCVAIASGCALWWRFPYLDILGEA